MRWRILFTALLFSLAATAQQAGSGPKPPLKDVPYLLEAQKLIQTDIEPVTESKSKDGSIVSVVGTSSKARTPLPEPIFIFAAEKRAADQLVLYHLDVNGNHRESTPGKRSDNDDQEDLRLTIRDLGQGLYRIEASHMLEAGEYALVPRDGKTAFCFSVY